MQVAILFKSLLHILAGMNNLRKEVSCDRKCKSDQYFLKAICQYMLKVLGLFSLQQNYF